MFKPTCCNSNRTSLAVQQPLLVELLHQSGGRLVHGLLQACLDLAHNSGLQTRTKGLEGKYTTNNAKHYYTTTLHSIHNEYTVCKTDCHTHLGLHCLGCKHVCHHVTQLGQFLGRLLLVLQSISQLRQVLHTCH